MLLQKRLVAEIRDLQRRGRIAVRELGLRGTDREILHSRERAFFHDAGAVRSKRGYERVTSEYLPTRWYPPAIAARVRCLDAVWAWLRPLQILQERSVEGNLKEWGYIDRAFAALADVRRAAPAPDPKEFLAWQRREERELERTKNRARVAVERKFGKFKAAA